MDILNLDGKTISHEVDQKLASARVMLRPAMEGRGIIAGGAVRTVVELAGVKDIYSRTSGKVRTTFNLAKACIDALKKTNLKIK